MNTSSAHRLVLVALAALTLGSAACAKEELSDDFFGAIDLAPYFGDGATVDRPAQALPLSITARKGYGLNKTLEYYDFGLVKWSRQGSLIVVTANPMYFFFDSRGNPMLAQPQRDPRLGIWSISGGNPTFSPVQDPAGKGYSKTDPYSVRPKKVIRDARRANSPAHQRPLIDMLHNGTTYSGVWEIVAVKAPAGYEPDTIKSLKTLQKGVDQGDFTLTSTGTVINCPVLEERQFVAPTMANNEVARPRIDVWYRTKLGSCLLTNGWEAIANVDALKDAGETKETGYATLFTASQISPDRNPMPIIKVEPKAKGEVQKRQIFVPVGRFYTPVVETKRNGIDFQLRNFDGLVADYDPSDRSKFTPVLVNWDVVVAEAPIFTAGNFKQASDMDPTQVKERGGGPWVRNLVILGSPDAVPTCGLIPDPMKAGSTKCDAATAVLDETCGALGMVCNPQTCKCDLPTSGFGEYCAPNVRRCKVKEELTGEELTFAPMGYTCHNKKTRGVCYPACNAEDPDLTDAKELDVLELDSRCGFLPGYTCETPTDSDKKKESVCIRKCSSTDPDKVTAVKCNTAYEVNFPTGKKDIAAELKCQSINGVQACSLIESLEPR